MSRGVNKVILLGHLGQNPELSYTPSGMAIARFSLATTEGRKKEDGTFEDYTEWHRIKVFGKSAETAGQYLSKGQQIYVEGRLHYDSYEKDGVKRYFTDIIVFDFRFLGRREDAPARSTSEGSYSNAPPPTDPHAGPDAEIEDDLPF